MKKKPSQLRLPCIPPNDYKGTIADWICECIRLGVIEDDGQDFYGDHMVNENLYNKILDECENHPRRPRERLALIPKGGLVIYLTASSCKKRYSKKKHKSQKKY
jgi:hypothetical protein